MKSVRFYIAVLGLALGLAVAGGAGAAGPDLILQDIYQTQNWGQVGDIVAYSIGTEICNYGDENGEWIANLNRHPVIAQNLYRLKDDRMEQLGQSWLKHGFASVNGSGCPGISCQHPGTSSLLGVGCSDPYGSGLNGDQEGFSGVGGLGPRSEVNAANGAYPFPYGDQGQGGNAIYKRLQVHVADVDPNLNPGARYFVEGQYVAPDEATAGNGANNPSYREVSVNGSLNLSFVGGTVTESDALMAWATIDPTVQLTDLDVPNDGRLRLATKVTDLGNGQYQYDYALHNINSDRSVQGFRILLPAGVFASNAGFHDVDAHSGEPFSNTDWTITALGPQNSITWFTDSHSTDPDANALRWGTTYNFSFQAAAPPVPINAQLRLFKPGSPTNITMATQGPGSGGGVPCGDISSFQARCLAGNQLQALIRLTDTSHDGESVEIEVDGAPNVLTINGNRANFGTTSSPGDHTVSLTNPGSCQPDLVVTCQ